MCCEPLKPVAVAEHEPQQSRMQDFMRGGRPRRERKEASLRRSMSHMDDESVELEEATTVAAGILDLNHYRIVNEIWHFTSMDRGYKCKCILPFDSPTK